jgi:hypothetical protein
MATESKIIIGIDNEVIELTGADKEAFLAQKAKDQVEFEARQVDIEAKAQAKAELLAKLGITAEEAVLLLS